MTYIVEVKNNGRLQLPKALREQLNLFDGSKLEIALQQGYVKMMTVQQKLDSAREILNQNAEWSKFSVDQFIEERRAISQQEIQNT